jgi:hypothetical protein
MIPDGGSVTAQLGSNSKSITVMGLHDGDVIDLGEQQWKRYPAGTIHVAFPTAAGANRYIVQDGCEANLGTSSPISLDVTTSCGTSAMHVQVIALNVGTVVADGTIDAPFAANGQLSLAQWTPVAPRAVTIHDAPATADHLALYGDDVNQNLALASGGASSTASTASVDGNARLWLLLSDVSTTDIDSAVVWIPDSASSIDIDASKVPLAASAVHTTDFAHRTVTFTAAPVAADFVRLHAFASGGQHLQWDLFAPPGATVRYPDLPPGSASIWDFIPSGTVEADVVDLDGIDGYTAALRAQVATRWYAIDNNVDTTPFRKRVNIPAP